MLNNAQRTILRQTIRMHLPMQIKERERLERNATLERELIKRLVRISDIYWSCLEGSSKEEEESVEGTYQD